MSHGMSRLAGGRGRREDVRPCTLELGASTRKSLAKRFFIRTALTARENRTCMGVCGRPAGAYADVHQYLRRNGESTRKSEKGRGRE